MWAEAVRVRVRAEPGLSEADAAALLLLYGRARHPDAYLEVVTPVVRSEDAHLGGVLLGRARALNPDAYLGVVIPSSRANDAHDIDELQDSALTVGAAAWTPRGRRRAEDGSLPRFLHRRSAAATGLVDATHVRG